MGETDLTEWDDDKRDRVLRERGIDLADLKRCFDGRPVVEAEDLRRAYGERRFNILVDVGGEILAITYTPRGARIRLISARRASRKERMIYAGQKAAHDWRD